MMMPQQEILKGQAKDFALLPSLSSETSKNKATLFTYLQF